MQEIRILIVDDHKLIRDSWSYFISLNPQFRVVGEASDGQEAISLTTQLRPDVIIMDINLPVLNGILATEKIKSKFPQTQILAVSMHNQPAYAKKMIQMGAIGYITKSSPQDEMYQAIMNVASGKKYICEEIKDLLSEQVLCNDQEPNNFLNLSKREMEVINLIKEGRSSKEVAVIMCLSTKTVEVHRYNILKKLDLRNTAALINFVSEQQMVL